MRMPRDSGPGVPTVIAAQGGDERAIDSLLAAYLPLIYNIVGRALNGHADVDDVVQETMLRVLRGMRDLRDPTAFRSLAGRCRRPAVARSPASAAGRARRRSQAG